MWWGAGRRRSSKSGGSAGAILIVVALVLAIVAPILARLLYLAVSRRREYLADATAVEFTRYPEALASALEKISSDREVLEVANRATAHLYIVNPVKPFEERYSALGSTHPPVGERIRILRGMAGGSVADYEQARHSIGAGPRRGIVRRRTLREEAAQARPLRDAKPRTGTRSPEELKSELERMMGPLGGGAGLYFVLCACGVPVPVPGGTVAHGILQCMGCGRLHDLRKKPADLRRMRPDGTVAPASPASEEQEAPAAEAAMPAEAAPALEGREPSVSVAGEEPGRPAGMSRTAAFEADDASVPPVETGAGYEPKSLDVDWADEAEPYRGEWHRGPAPPSEGPVLRKDAGADPFGITFDDGGNPVYPPELTCPHCSRAFPVPEGFIGSRGPCPNCREMIVFFERE
jgi:hypothetical protein